MPSTEGHARATRRCLPPPRSAHEKRRAAGDCGDTSSGTWSVLAPLAPCSDALLQGGRRESLHDLPRRLCLYHHHLAEDLPLTRLRGGLSPRLQTAQSREGEHARLRALLRGDLREAVDDLR